MHRHAYYHVLQKVIAAIRRSPHCNGGAFGRTQTYWKPRYLLLLTAIGLLCHAAGGVLPCAAATLAIGSAAPISTCPGLTAGGTAWEVSAPPTFW